MNHFSIAIAIPFKNRPEHVLLNVQSLLPQLSPEHFSLVLVDNSDDCMQDTLTPLISAFKNTKYVRTGGLTMTENWNIAVDELHKYNAYYSLLLEDKTIVCPNGLQSLLEKIRNHKLPDYLCWRSSIYNYESKSLTLPCNLLTSHGGSISLALNKLISSSNISKKAVNSIVEHGIMSRYLSIVPRDCTLIKTNILPETIPLDIKSPDYFIGLYTLLIAKSFVYLTDSITQVVYTRSLTEGNGGKTMAKRCDHSYLSTASEAEQLRSLLKDYILIFDNPRTKLISNNDFLLNVTIFADFIRSDLLRGHSCKISNGQVWGLVKEIIYRTRLGVNMKKELQFLLESVNNSRLFISIFSALANPFELQWLVRSLIAVAIKKIRFKNLHT